MLKHLTFLLAIALSINVFAKRNSEELAIANERASVLVNQQLDLVVQNLSDMKFKKTTLRALDSLINRAIVELKNKKLGSDSETLSTEWTRFKSTQLSAFDLGDHRPLSQWLKEKHDMLEAKLGARVMKLTRLSDIKIFNYSIPVVYNPTGLEWDRIEYQKHFVPYMGASAYWISSGACSVILTLPASLACTPAALAVRVVTEKAIAPRLSDTIYVAANQ